MDDNINYSLKKASTIRETSTVNLTKFQKAKEQVKVLVEEFKAENPYDKIRHDKVILKNMIFMVSLWSLSNFTYYLISAQLKYIKGDIYINTLASAGSEIVATLSSVVMAKKFSYKNSMLISFWIATVGMVGLIIYDSLVVEANDYVTATLVIISKFGVAATKNLTTLGNPKLFEMTILATSLGLCHGISRLTNILAAPIAEI